MEDLRKDEIIYEEDWQQLDEPKCVNSEDDSKEQEKPDMEKQMPKKQRQFPALITIQLVVCLIIAFLVFMLKAMNSDTYARLCDIYDDLMSETLLSNSTFEDIDLSHYFEATTDERCATEDEI